MALTKEFKETVVLLCGNSEYRKELLIEALSAYLEGEVETGNSLLRDYLNGTQSFADVADQMSMKEAGLRRMVGPKGNATAKNLFMLFKVCQIREGFDLSDHLSSAA